MVDENTYFKLRADMTKKDSDAVLVTKLLPEVEMRICCGFDFNEADHITKDKNSCESPYFGINFDI
jgi:hypothetical protein